MFNTIKRYIMKLIKDFVNECKEIYEIFAAEFRKMK